MKYFRLIAFLSLLIPNFVFAISITHTLKFGTSGSEVLELQRLLNKDKQTEVASFGPGSLGYETSFFGLATKQAVIKFQEKYRDEVLTPAGLNKGTGIVGNLTRNKLTLLELARNNPSPVIPITQNKPEIKVNLATSTSPSETTVDFSNIKYDKDSFLSAIEKVGLEKGFSKEKLATLKNEVEKNIETKHSEKLFLSEVQKSGVKVHINPAQTTKKNGGIMSLFYSVIDFFTPEKAYAFGTPFGGRVLFTFLCTCSGNWLVTLMPTGPTYATLLTYYQGTQIYMGYNLPFTLNVLGEYTQGSVCEFYVGLSCAEIPSQGMIGPTTGSSPL